MAAAWLQNEEGLNVVLSQCLSSNCGGEMMYPGHGGSSSSWQQSSPSYSSFTTSSSTTTSTDETLESFAASFSANPLFRAMVRQETMKQVTVNQAVSMLGGGEKGLQILTEHILFSLQQHISSGRKFSVSQLLEQLVMSKSQGGVGDLLTGYGNNNNNHHHHGGYSSSSDNTSHARRVGPEANLATSGAAPFHQVPRWNQPVTMEHWNPSFYTMNPQSSIPCVKPAAEEQWNPLRTTDMSTYRATMDLPPLNHLLDPGMVGFENGVCHQLRTCAEDGAADNNIKPDLAAANRRAARKNRILLRQKSVPHQRGLLGGATANGCSSDPSSQGRLRKILSNQIPRGLLSSSQGQGCNMDTLSFLLHKVLQPSDVSSLGRIVISRDVKFPRTLGYREAETHLPYLAMREGILITMEDFDTDVQWTFRFRFWPNNKSRMYLLESTGEFVKAHQLTRGDILVLYRNFRGSLVIRGKKNAQDDGNAEADSKGSLEDGKDGNGRERTKRKFSSAL